MSYLSCSKYRPLGLSLLALSFALAACSPKGSTEAEPTLAALESSESALPPLPDVQPMVAGPAAPVRRAPAAAALPKARTLSYANVSGNDRYAWIDRANRINETIGDSPPDYGFDYQDGVQPYGWESAGGYRTYAEPTDGGYRYYYYDPGANEPYLVRDPSYSYGYSGGRIVTVYDRGGRVLDGNRAQQQADYASRYYDRGRAMRAAADRRQRRGVVASSWADQRPVISTQRAEWNRTQSNTPEWRSYRNDHAAEDQRLVDERTARAQAAREFSTWQSKGFRGQTPTIYERPQGGRRDGNGYGQQRAQQQQAVQQQDSRDAQTKASDLALRQRRDAQTQAKAAQVNQQKALQAGAQQQRVAAQAERQRVAKQSQAAVQQQRDLAQKQRVAAGAERLRVARERQVVVKQQAVQQRAVVLRQREADKVKRVAATRQKAADAQQVRQVAQQKAAEARKNAARPVPPVVQPKPPQAQKPAPQLPKPGAGPRGEQDGQRPGSNPG